MPAESFTLELPADVAEAVAKLTPEQRAVFQQALTEKLKRLLPLVNRLVDQAAVLAAGNRAS